MKKMDRRRFVIVSAAAAASLKSFGQAASGGGAQAATLTLYPDRPGPAIPANFVGLSYETQQLSQPDFFSPANTGLIAQFRALAPHGVLRLGGNTSDYGFWKPTPDAVPPPRAKRPAKMGDPPPDLSYDVTPEAVHNLRAFLDATGWTCLYGINFGTNTPAIAADEAAFAAKVLGAKLEYFQVGNEADRFGSTIRDPKTWSADTYFDEWLPFANAIRAKVPGAKFGLPDTAGNPEWYAVVVNRLLALKDRPEVGALTHHYYFAGPPANPKANIGELLKADAHVAKLASDVSAAAARLGEGEHRTVAYRMTEGNTCYRGGKPGVSDVFAAALWSADYALLLASNNYSGVNLHGGTGKSVANSVGGFLPGDVLLKDSGATPAEIATHPHPFYTPIATFDSDYRLEPVAYGLKFAGAFSGATLLQGDLTAQLQSASVNATAYAAKLANGNVSVILLNKDAQQDLALSLDFGAEKSGEVEIETLTAPAPDRREAHIARAPKPGRLRDGKYTITVAHASALRLTVK
jgi:hypothetical protein